MIDEIKEALKNYDIASQQDYDWLKWCVDEIERLHTLVEKACRQSRQWQKRAVEVKGMLAQAIEAGEKHKSEVERLREALEWIRDHARVYEEADVVINDALKGAGDDIR